MKSKAISFVVVFLLWTVLCWPLDWQHAAVGVIASVIVAAIAGDMLVTRPHKVFRLARYLWFAYYVPLFVWECLKANLEVAYLVAHPAAPIRPGIVKVRSRLKSDVALTFLANSITLTPGTLCVDIDGPNGILYVHWIRVKDTDTQKATEAIVSTFENVLAKIFE